MSEHRFAEDRRQWIIGLVTIDLLNRIRPELEADARQSLEENATEEEVEDLASMIAEFGDVATAVKRAMKDAKA